jgi:hypothetical protein
MDKETLEQMTLEHSQMQKLNKRMGVSQHKIEDVLKEMNERVVQYLGQFSSEMKEKLIFQTMQDFQKHLTILQMSKKNYKFSPMKPVCQLNDKRNVFVNPYFDRGTTMTELCFVEVLKEKE